MRNKRKSKRLNQISEHQSNVNIIFTAQQEEKQKYQEHEAIDSDSCQNASNKL